MAPTPQPALHSRTRKSRNAAIDTTIDTYEMANLSAVTTGLPLTVWVSPRGRARHDAWIKVCLTPGKMVSSHVAVVGIRPEPWPVTPGLGKAEFDQVARWIKLNEAALMEFWNETIDSIDLAGKLKKLDADSGTE